MRYSCSIKNKIDTFNFITNFRFVLNVIVGFKSKQINFHSLMSCKYNYNGHFGEELVTFNLISSFFSADALSRSYRCCLIGIFVLIKKAAT